MLVARPHVRKYRALGLPIERPVTLNHTFILHSIAWLLSILMKGALQSCSYWEILLGRHASSSPLRLSFIFCLTLLIFLPMSVCRSSSPCCSSVSGFHQSERLRHSQLVSIASRPPDFVSVYVNIITKYQLQPCICVGQRQSTIHWPHC